MVILMVICDIGSVDDPAVICIGDLALMICDIGSVDEPAVICNGDLDGDMCY
jgi:hypothetical protein